LSFYVIAIAIYLLLVQAFTSTYAAVLNTSLNNMNKTITKVLDLQVLFHPNPSSPEPPRNEAPCVQPDNHSRQADSPNNQPK
jgi:hypothetical protein